MADSKIDGLSAITATEVVNADLIAVFDSSTGVTKKMTRLEFLKMLAVGSTTDYVLTSTGDGTEPTFQVLPQGGMTSVQVFTTSGTWTRPAGVTKIRVTVTGGGGSGDPATNNKSAGAGGTVIKFIDVSSISASTTLTVGAGATTSGAAGGQSLWADGTNTLTGGGGAGNVTGGTASGGDINIRGGFGATTGSGGVASYWGGSGETTTKGAYGSGGQENSGDGGDGIVYVEEYL